MLSPLAVPCKGLKESTWRNPYRGGPDGDRAVVIAGHHERVRTWMLTAPGSTSRELRRLAGKPLACSCRHDGPERTPDSTCHGDALLELIVELKLGHDG